MRMRITFPDGSVREVEGEKVGPGRIRVPELDVHVSSLDYSLAFLNKRGGKWILGWYPVGNIVYMGCHPSPQEVEVEFK